MISDAVGLILRAVLTDVSVSLDWSPMTTSARTDSPSPTPSATPPRDPGRPAPHLVVGAGPAGTSIALLLADRGVPVTVLTRSGTGPDHPLVTRVAGTATDADLLTQLATGAAAIHNCVNPPYHRWHIDWPPMHRAFMAAAERTGAVLVMMDNLYGFGPDATLPMGEDDPMRATGAKGATRAAMATELLAAHSAGRLRATLARASDFYGPRVTDALLGERCVPRLLAGKKVTLLGDPDALHSFSYMPDVARTMVTIATDERAWGRAWHVPNAPALTTRQTVDALAAAAGTTARITAVPKTALRLVGLASPTMRALLETWYQWSEPFVTDSALTERTFGLTATPIDVAAAETVAWWRSRTEGGSAVDPSGSGATSHSVHIGATRG